MRMTSLIGALLLMSMPAAATSQSKGFVLVVNATNPVTSLTKDEVSRIFLKLESKWDHGPGMAPVDLDRSVPARDAFTRAVHGRSVNALLSYWQQQIFSGRDVPPPEMPTDAEVLAHVRATPGGIGYVREGSSLGAGVKAVEIQP